MTEQEQKVMDLTTQLWNEFLKLPGGHDADVPDFRFHIHGIQRIIIARGYVNQEEQKPNINQREFINIDTSQDVGMPAIKTGHGNWVLSAFAAVNEKMKNPYKP